MQKIALSIALLSTEESRESRNKEANVKQLFLFLDLCEGTILEKVIFMSHSRIQYLLTSGAPVTLLLRNFITSVFKQDVLLIPGMTRKILALALFF